MPLRGYLVLAEEQRVACSGGIPILGSTMVGLNRVEARISTISVSRSAAAARQPDAGLSGAGSAIRARIATSGAQSTGTWQVQRLRDQDGKLALAERLVRIHDAACPGDGYQAVATLKVAVGKRVAVEGRISQQARHDRFGQGNGTRSSRRRAGGPGW